MAKKTGKRNQHVAAFISKLLLGAAAVSFAPKLTLAEEIQKDSLDWNAAYYNNSYEKFVTESEIGYYIAVNNYLYFVEKSHLHRFYYVINQTACIKIVHVRQYFSRDRLR